MKFTIAVTRNCNLSCKYCYSGQKTSVDMSMETAKRIIDFAADMAVDEKEIDVSFFGGEPTLCFPLIKETTDYIRSWEERTGKNVHISMTTNGTLLTSDILRFLKREKFDLCVSLDGPEHVHNLYRCSGSGKGSYDRIMENIRRAGEELDTMQINAVYSTDTTKYLPEVVRFLAGLPVAGIHLNPNICETWPQNSYPALKDIFMEIADYYVACYQEGKELAINAIDNKIILFLKGGYDNGDRCGMGETEWGFAPNGNIYPCERFIGEEDREESGMCLGNVFTGMDITRRCSVLKQRGNKNKECGTCRLQPYCMNWCGCTNYYMTGAANRVGPMLCENEKAAIHASKFVLDSLKENTLFLSHFGKYWNS
ncbi:MAG: radical SAM protein [bacterium]|nr:radical SAM protein [bacterium]